MNMKKTLIIFTPFFLLAALLVIAKESIIATRPGQTGKDIKLHIEAGEHWVHLFESGSVSIKVTPQIAVWVEDPEGNYLDTLYVTRRTATQKWRGKAGPYEEKGNIRRKASLPYWAHRRGVRYDDGLFLPTKKDPLPDSITSASPKESFQLRSSVGEDLDNFMIFVEINNSTDFNEYYTRDADPKDAHFSGGSFGSGQPSVIYSAAIDINDLKKEYELQLAGHSSPSGENGQLHTDVSKLTTAKHIAGKIAVTVN